jgi:carboxyl-terminal processing protease
MNLATVENTLSMERRTTKILIVSGILISQLLLIGMIAFLAYFSGFRTGAQSPQAIVIRGVSNIDAKGGTTIDFREFWEVWHTLKESYITGDAIDDKKLFYGAIRGMVDAVGDPYTVFLSPEEAQEFEDTIKGASFGGIGAEIGMRDSQLIILAPLKDSPAERAGLRSGDAILSINGTPTTGITIEKAVGQIRGEPGSIVTLLIQPEGTNPSKEVKITRAIIEIPTLDWTIEEGDILVITLYSFNEKASSQFYQTIQEASARHSIKGILLDLRGNPGGYLEVAVDIASWFINRGETIVIEEFGDGRQQVFPSRRKGLLAGIPTVVLIDRGSASASEILAGALRDRQNAVLIGERTYGKGSVQELRNLRGGSELKVTVARWILPGGDVIDAQGLTPDLIVPFDPKAKDDTQMTAALQVLRGKIHALSR